MFLSVDNDDYGVLTDADGRVIMYPVSAETETGIVTCIVKEDDRPESPFIVDMAKGEVQRFRFRFKAPLGFDRSANLPDAYMHAIPLEELP